MEAARWGHYTLPPAPTSAARLSAPCQPPCSSALLALRASPPSPLLWEASPTSYPAPTRHSEGWGRGS